MAEKALTAVIIVIGVNTDGRREVLGLEIGTSEAEPIWTEFLHKLTRRGLRGVKPVISDAYEGIVRLVGALPMQQNDERPSSAPDT